MTLLTTREQRAADLRQRLHAKSGGLSAGLPVAALVAVILIVQGLVHVADEVNIGECAEGRTGPAGECS